jgi:polyisoprenyl-phosphate glycosyltransferase
MSEFLISIIIPVFNEGKQIPKSLSVIRKILDDNQINHEFILIDDGSKDDTWDVIKHASTEMPGIGAIRFSRNFGKESALCAGLEAAMGDACVVLDADLQHPPEIIPEMVRLWREEGYEIIEGVKFSRGKEHLLNKISALVFYKVLKGLSGYDLNRASDFKLLDAKVVASWRLLTERNTFFRGMAAWVGFKRTSIPFVVADRSGGKTKWSSFRLFKLALTAITSFSSLPLQLVTFLGIAFLIGSIPLGIETLYLKFRGEAVDGFTTVILLLLIIGSTLMISLGIIGTYIAKIFDEVKYRPRYLVSETVKKSEERN